MKGLELIDILKVLNVNTKLENCYINYVTDNIKKLGNNTLVFHINKDVELNVFKFKRFENCYIITDQPLLKTTEFKEKYIFVENVINSYKTFINYYRGLFNLEVVAVTGTCGKTTTKEMIVQILKQKHQVVNTISSKNALYFNNDYLMSINENTKFGVFEVAVSTPGNLIYTADIYKPSIGIITSIGIDHLNACKSIYNYIRAKAEMLTALKNKGILIINNDDENIKKIDMSNYKGKIITYGIKNDSDFYVKDLKYIENGMEFKLITEEGDKIVNIPVFGEHNVYNALAAIAAIKQLNVDINEAIDYLSNFIPIRSHIDFQKGINNSTIIDDTWSSNPTSIEAALKVLNSKGINKEKILVIGKVSYLGDFEKECYEKIAKMALDYQVDILVTFDDDAKLISDTAKTLKMKKAYHFSKPNELTRFLKHTITDKSLVLFKTSMLDKSCQEIIDQILIENK